jgi:hypothetical protein
VLNRQHLYALWMDGDFSASSGLLMWFKQQHGIWDIVIKKSGNKSAASEFQSDFEDFIKKP